jgi:hypothetical protein
MRQWVTANHNKTKTLIPDLEAPSVSSFLRKIVKGGVTHHCQAFKSNFGTVLDIFATIQPFRHNSKA